VSIFNPLDVVRKHTELPVVCGSCCHRLILNKHDAATDEALIAATNLHSLYLESALLDRAAALFACFPESRCALKVNKEELYPKRLVRDDEDPEFETALASDPELSLFLRRRMFHLPSRRRAIIDLIARLEENDFSNILCPACMIGTLHFPDGFLHL
jgi:hypothetical protein